ncbi:MAG: DUF883 family protein [Gammaproteobacteria bacterium]|nr:DUF883 family protein [Gammaproteobacteria bacterium]
MATDKPHQAISDAERAIHSTSERVARAAHEAIDTLSDYGTRTEDRLRQTGRIATERGREYADEMSSYIARRPLVSLGIALGVGLLLGALSRGRD